jgi:protein phosphatase
MGSRAVVVICKDESVAQKRFGVTNEGRGIIYTRTGRRFFEDVTLETALLDHLDGAITRAGLWDDLQTDWMVLDCELMPWSAKAQGLLQDQYAAVGSSASHALKTVIETLQTASPNYPEIAPLLEKYERRAGHITDFISAYRRYCWDVVGVDDLRLAPFHIMATEGAVHIDKPHLWHMETIARLHTEGDTRIYPTAYQVVNLKDENSVEAGVTWWESLTARGGEGMVVKPMEFVMMGKRGIIQPALKVRGRDYLRIIYGAEYVDHLDLLRDRAIGHKRNLALREFALGIEALVRFVSYEPLRRVHECVFGILALESEPIDPRL